MKHISKISIMIIGFALMSLGVAINVRAEIGIMPWDVFHQGISLLTGITIGQASIIVGYTILIIGCLLKFYPGPGTFANIMIMGIMIDLFLEMVPRSQSFLQSLIMCILGSIIAALGTAVYLKPKFGAGARDGMIMGLVAKFKKPQGLVRFIIEGSVVALGIYMGGNFGIGTFISLFTLGICVDFFFKLIDYNPKIDKQMTIVDLLHNIKSTRSIN